MSACARCGAPLPVQSGRGRPRKFCLDCRPVGDRAAVSRQWREANPAKVAARNAARRRSSDTCSECGGAVGRGCSVTCGEPECRLRRRACLERERRRAQLIVEARRLRGENRRLGMRVERLDAAVAAARAAEIVRRELERSARQEERLAAGERARVRRVLGAVVTAARLQLRAELDARVAPLLEQGVGYKAIGRELGISRETARESARRIRRREELAA